MALAIDSQESGGAGHSFTSSPAAYNFTNAAGNWLLIGVAVTNASATPPTINSVSYGGKTASLVPGSSSTKISASATRIAFYQVSNPPTGSNGVSVSFSGAGYLDCIVGCISFSGAGSVGDAVSAQDSSAGTAASVTLNGTTSGSYVLSLLATGSGVSSASFPTALSWELNVSKNTNGDNAALGQQTTSGGSVTAAYTVANDHWLIDAVEIFAATAPPPSIAENLGSEWATQTTPGAIAATFGLSGSVGASNTGMIALRSVAGPSPPPPAPPSVVKPSWYVSPTGSDSNAGDSALAPFKTLEAAQTAARNSTTNKHIYLRAGTYARSATLNLSSADNNEAWEYYPPDGVNSAVLDGGGTLNQFVNGSGCSGVTWNGIKLQHGVAFGVEFQGGSTNCTITNCEAAFFTSTGTPADVLSVSDATNCTISNNYLHDIAAFGIAAYAYYAGQSCNGTVIENNVLINVNTVESDCGAIYTDMDGSGATGGSVVIRNNFIAGWGPSNSNGHAIYCDDSSSNVDIYGNVIAAPSTRFGSNNSNLCAFFHHNGTNITIHGNIFDLGSSGFTFPANWSQDNTSVNKSNAGCTFEGNIVIASNTGAVNVNAGQTTGAYAFVQNSYNVAGDFTIENNLYWNYAGGSIQTNGNKASDSNPVSANPQLNGNTYTIAPTSPALTSPVSFPQIVGGWGPPGFVMPTIAHSYP